MNYRVIMDHDKTYYFKTLDGVFKFLQLIKDETVCFDKHIDIQIDDMERLR